MENIMNTVKVLSSCLLLISTKAVLSMNLSSEYNKVFFTISKVEDNNPRISFLIRNNSTKDVLIAKRFTPIDGILQNLFEVEYNGENLSYRGKMARLPDLTKDEFIKISARSNLSRDIDLSKEYDFSGKGKYTIRFKQSVYLIEQKENFRSAKRIEKISNPIEIQIN